MARRTPDSEVEEGALTLTRNEQRVLTTELTAFAENLRDPALRERYLQLSEAVAAGSVPSPLVGPLTAMLELILQGQRVRIEHGPEGARALSSLYARTPQGIALSEAAREVNEAFTALRGQTLELLAFAPVPGGHSLEVETNGGRLMLTIDRAGVRVEYLDVAG